MRKLILVKYGELWLKSFPVRRIFEKKLKGNIKSCLRQANAKAQVRVANGRMYIYPEGRFDAGFLSHTFGIVAYAPAVEVNKDMEEIKRAAEAFAKPQFKIRARRTDKSFPLSSMQIQREVGMHLEAKGWRAELQKPKHLIKIEVRDNAFVYAAEKKGPGGLPLGSAGTVAARLRDTDDLAAAWLMMKRGAECIFIKPQPRLPKAIGKWSAGRKPRTAVSLKEARKHAGALVDCRAHAKKGFVVLNPLAAFSREEKGELLRKIRGW